VTNENKERLKAYEQLCTSYRAIDDFRTKLLGFLPLATATGIFFLIADKDKIVFAQDFFQPIGAFGFVVTLGLFLFELHGIKKCSRLIEAGTELEKNLGIEKKEGQFIDRPLGVLGFINEPFAAGVIYPAVLAAWAFLAIDFESKQDCSAFNLFQDATWAIRVFIVGFIVTFVYNLSLILPAHVKKWKERRRN